MFMCEQHGTCCDYRYADSLKDVDEEGKDCCHLIEVAPVVHAHWIRVPLKNHPDEYKPKCSRCECLFLCEYKYCPNCGAKCDENSVFNEIKTGLQQAIDYVKENKDEITK